MGDQLRFQALEGRILTPTEVEAAMPGTVQFDEREVERNGTEENARDYWADEDEGDDIPF